MKETMSTGLSTCSGFYGRFDSYIQKSITTFTDRATRIC